MSFELMHTSVPRDLDGQSGFGVAAMTRDLPRPLRDALVAWSDGSELDAAADRAISYAVCQVGGAAWPVLTCVTRCGSDWSGRANRVAHHLVLEPGDRCIEGPIALARAFRFASEVPEVGLRSPPLLPQPVSGGDATRGVDPAWFELLADRVTAADALSLAIRLPRGLDPLALLAAVTARLEPRRRWAVQWSTAPVFHAGRGLPTIVIARKDDPYAFDLSLPAPSPRVVKTATPSDLASTRPTVQRVMQVAGQASPSGPDCDASTSAPRSGQPWRTDRALGEPVASMPAKPLLPILLFAAASVIMLVALGLLLW
jgi:hypothetical protein